MKNNFKSIETVIGARLKLQSTQKMLMDKFDIYLPSVVYLRHIIDQVNKFEVKQKKDFAIILGGKANLKITLDYLNNFKPEAITA